VGHLGHQGAEQQSQPAPGLLGQARDLGAERSPAELGLGADDQQGVAGVARQGCGVDLGGRPTDPPDPVVADLGLGPRRREVEELLGVDLGHQFGVVTVDQVPDGAAGGVPGVVPTLEGDQQDGLLEGGS